MITDLSLHIDPWLKKNINTWFIDVINSASVLKCLFKGSSLIPSIEYHWHMEDRYKKLCCSLNEHPVTLV